MSGVDTVQDVSSGTGLQLTSSKQSCWLDVDSATVKAYGEKLGQQIDAQKVLITQLQARLDNKGYVQNAPKAVVNQTKDQLHEAKSGLERLETERERFSA